MTSRVLIIKSLIVLGGFILVIRLFSIQLLDPNYKRAAEDNVVRKEVQYPYRGLIHDRNDNLLVFNTPVFDLMVVPNEVAIPDTSAFLQLLEIDEEYFSNAMDKAKRYARNLPSLMVSQISNEHLARIQGSLMEYEGFYLQPRTVREYSYPGMAHVLGYVGEVSLSQIQNDTTGYYRGGDYIGISGIEKEYENDLRRARCFIQVGGCSTGS